MANYRPKSLEELNSVYDKTLSSQNVIKDSASAISTAAFTDTPAVSAQSIDDFFAEQTDATVGTCADLTQDIKNFIKDFGKPATKEDEIAIRRKPVVPIKVKSSPLQNAPQSRQPEKTDEAVVSENAPKAAPEVAAAPAEQTKPEKTEFVITAEKNELFDEYMRIMSDEDDEAEYSKSKARKKKKGKKSPEVTVQKEEAPSEEKAEEFTASLLPDFEPEEDAESFISFADGEQKSSQDKKPAADTLSDESDSDSTDIAEEADEEEEKQPRKKVALQLVLFLLLFVTLFSALAVTAVHTVVKVNSGELFADKYYIYTASCTDSITDVNEGDLIIVENTAAENNEVFAYSTQNGIAFAVQTFSGEPERTYGKNGTNDNIVVMNTSIKGKVTRIYPSLGKAAALIGENFMTVIVSLLVLAVFIILLLIFAFRHTSPTDRRKSKDNLSFNDEEDIEEADEDDFSLN